MENSEVKKDGWSWMGFLFSSLYYAGYGNIKKSVILAIIGGLLPLFSIVVAIYGGLNAKKDLPIGEIPFKWVNILIPILVSVVISFISLTIIEMIKS